MARGGRRILVVLGLALGIPLLVCLGFAGYLFALPSIESYIHRVPFSSEQWKARPLDDGTRWPTRLRMADDLIARRILQGQPRHKVVQLLGPPDDTPYFADWNLVYRLGPERGLFSIDSEWLVIRLDTSGAVSEYRLVTD